MARRGSEDSYDVEGRSSSSGRRESVGSRVDPVRPALPRRSFDYPSVTAELEQQEAQVRRLREEQVRLMWRIITPLGEEVAESAARHAATQRTYLQREEELRCIRDLLWRIQEGLADPPPRELEPGEVLG